MSVDRALFERLKSGARTSTAFDVQACLHSRKDPLAHASLLEQHLKL